MPRIPPVRGLFSLRRAASNRAPFALSRAISTTTPVRDLRSKLWKDGEAPGPEDPYQQRPDPEDPSSLPEEALRLREAGGSLRARSLRETRLAMPPTRTEAITEEEVSAADPSYTPANSLEELEEIEPLKTWWDQPGHWGPESQFVGFGRAEKVLDVEVVEVYLRRAVVEVLALKQAGKLSEWAVKRWAEGSRTALDATLESPITVTGTDASVGGNSSAIVDQLTGPQEDAEVPLRLSAEEAREMVKTWDPSWKEVALDTQAKFAIRKRLYQLTGSLVPDARLGPANNVGQLLTLAVKQPKPKKLAEVLEEQSGFSELPNVKLHSKKIGAIDREVVVGRWKVIEEELKKRDLPVTGTANLPGQKERRWLRGIE